MNIEQWITENNKKLNTFPKPSITLAQGLIADDEKIFLVETVEVDQVLLNPFSRTYYRDGVLVVTQQKVVYASKKLLDEKLESINISDIQNLSLKKKFLECSWLEIRGTRSTITITSNKNVLMNIQTAIGEAKEQNSAKKGTASTAEPSKPSQSLKEQLKELKGLLDEGIITQEEYDAKRKKILDI